MAHILLIDDDAGVRRFVGAVLRRAGHDVTEAADGLKGLRALAGAAVDLVITDLIMPDKEGLETIHELRQSGNRVRILAISGGFPGNSLNILDMAKRIGADGALGKPFTPDELLAAVERLLAKPAG
jgi:DNA-binding response OmpR family regulator